jgi:acyl-CoA reductase-like NAD-dependent aldehyde dehydrogenase
MQRYRSFVGGSQRETSHVDIVKSPYDGSPVAEVSRAGEAEMEDAIASAAQSFAALHATPVHQRATWLDAIASELGKRRDEFAELITRESGKPIRYSRAEVARAITTFALGASTARTFGGEQLPVDLTPGAEGRLCITTLVPRGPVGAIAPFNFPLNLVAHKLSPALAVGTSVVLKPAHQSPATAHALAELMHGAGVLPGSLNVLHTPPELGERLATDERIKVLSFTGSDAVGWKLKRLAWNKQVLLELGGNAPCIVDETVDLEAIMPRLVEACWANAGQICIKPQRLLVSAAIFDEFSERFVAETARVKVGDPLDPETVVGPIIEARHVARLLEWIAEARAAGARLLCGGEADRQLLSPTVLTGTKHELRAWSQEAFGPITLLEPWQSLDEALEVANASRFGLQASLFTNDLPRALRAFRALQYGGVLINDPPSFRADNFPYGGTKESGFGREGVRYAAQEYCEQKVLVLGPMR